MLAVLLRPFRQNETNALELGLVREVIYVSWLGGVATLEIYNQYERFSNCEYQLQIADKYLPVAASTFQLQLVPSSCS